MHGHMHVKFMRAVNYLECVALEDEYIIVRIC
jgi:hypothetical protein